MPFDSWLGDVRFAWRNAIRRPAFTLLVVVTLALGLGVSSAVFAIVDPVLLRPLPYPEPSRLVFVWQTLPDHNVFELEPTPTDYAAWRALDAFASVAMVATGSFTLTGEGDAERVRGARMTATLMPLLGIALPVGRHFDAAEDSSDAAPVVILSDGLWRRRYGTDPRVVGRSIQVDGVPHTVIGIAPPRAVLPGHIAGFSELWLPARLTPDERANAISHNYTVIGRLARGVTTEAASTRIAAFASVMAREHPATHRGLGGRIVSVADDTTRGVKPALLVLMGGVALLLLIACANVSTLLLVRAADRGHDSAVRAALGATRGRLVWLSVAEGVLLAGLGGAAALGVAAAALQLMLTMLAASLPPATVIHMDLRVAAATLLVAIAVGGAIGLAVGLRGPSPALADALKNGARASGSARVTRARDLLVVAQIAFAVILLGAGGLLVRSLSRLAGVPIGFTADRVLTVSLSLDAGYDTNAPRAAFVGRLLDRIGSAPGVERAAVTSRLPLGGSRGADGIEIEGRPAQRGERLIADQRHVTPDYFRTMGIRMQRGRSFTGSDDARAEPVVLVNRTMADQFWPGSDPIDRRIRVTSGLDRGPWYRIVGIVDDVRHVSLTRPAVAEMYRPYAQAAVASFTVVVKTRDDPAAASGIVRSAVRAIDPNLPVYDVRTMEDRIAGSFAQMRATMLLLMATAVLAATLAAVAIYGSIWYSVTQRIPEIGLRLALGATAASVARAVIGRAFALTAAGAVVGVVAAIGAAPLLRGLLFETRGTDPATYSAVIAAVVTLTAAASVVPARRAMRVDPVIAMRN
jgi:putative ABC transport system permease protein